MRTWRLAVPIAGAVIALVATPGVATAKQSCARLLGKGAPVLTGGDIEVIARAAPVRRQAHGVKIHSAVYYGCALKSPRRVRLGTATSTTGTGETEDVTLSQFVGGDGPYVGFVRDQQRFDALDDVSVHVLDLRTGAVVFAGHPIECNFDDLRPTRVGYLDVGRTGVAGWIGYCEPGAGNEVEIHAVAPGGQPLLLDSGPDIDRAYLRVTNRAVTWIRAGTIKQAQIPLR